MQLTYEKIEELLHIKATSRKSYADLAESELGDRTLATALRSTLRKYNKARLPDPEPRNIAPVLSTPESNTLVIADIHAPYQNTTLLTAAIDLAISAGVSGVDIAGDLHDFNSLSSLSKGETTTAAETDIRHSRQILTVLANTFERIRIVSGNHDEYWIKKRGGTFQDLIYQEVLQGKYSDQVQATDYDYMLLGKTWLVGHLSNYDETPGLLAAKIADIFDRNVIVGHDHVFGFQRSKKAYLGVSTGAMLTPDRFWYKLRRLNTFPPFGLGFSLIINEQLYMFNEYGNGPYNGAIQELEYWKQHFREGRHLL